MKPTEPSEFALFVRETAKHAIESVAARVKKLDKPIRGIVRSWSRLDEKDKDTLIDEMIAASLPDADGDAEPTAAKGASTAKKAKKKTGSKKKK